MTNNIAPAFQNVSEAHRHILQMDDLSAHERASILERITLADDEPDFDIHYGTSPIVLLGHHTGWKVPQNAIDEKGLPLGLPLHWFDPEDPRHRHEACDWGTTELFEKFDSRFSKLTLRKSRLEYDGNRIRGLSIPERSSEHPDIMIPGNINLSEEETQRRLASHDEHVSNIIELINHVKRIHGGAIVIEQHSCAEEWHDHDRQQHEIGTVFFENSPLVREVEGSYTKKIGFPRFASQFPYDALLDKALQNRIVSPALAREHNVLWMSIETRNDLLRPQTLHEYAAIHSRVLEDLEMSPQLKTMLQRDKSLASMVQEVTHESPTTPPGALVYA